MKSMKKATKVPKKKAMKVANAEAVHVCRFRNAMEEAHYKVVLAWQCARAHKNRSRLMKKIHDLLDDALMCL